MSLIWVFSFSTANAEIFAACAWRQAPPQLHKDFVTEFFKSPHEGEAVLYKYKDQLLQLSAVCAGRSDIDSQFVMGAIFDQAAMEGAAAEVKASMGVDRARLDLVWSKEFDAAMCLIKDYAEDYNATFAADVCTLKNPAQKFLRHFKVSPKTDEPDADRLMRYFVAKAQDAMDTVEFSIQSESHPPPKPAPPKP